MVRIQWKSGRIRPLYLKSLDIRGGKGRYVLLQIFRLEAG